MYKDINIYIYIYMYMYWYHNYHLRYIHRTFSQNNVGNVDKRILLRGCVVEQDLISMNW